MKYVTLAYMELSKQNSTNLTFLFRLIYLINHDL